MNYLLIYLNSIDKKKIMINAEVQCDIVLKSFVAKVVSQPCMDPNKIQAYCHYQYLAMVVKLALPYLTIN